MGWRAQLSTNPFASMVAATAILLGGLGMVIGDRASRGMSISLAGHANVIAHLWGAMFAVGGVLTLFGIYRPRLTVELPGLYLLAGGYGFYCLTVLTGLRTHGLAAGLISGALTLGSLLKARAITARARHVRPEPPVEPPVDAPAVEGRVPEPRGGGAG
ncbi:hypothetical protein [Actinomadura parmotrematis]|uniref:DUF4383 domain-containing protein n=1 Tax=Actinomadura parmotrematis TaxID=2864039 RepID=A0ABS7FWS7_9ACTN|nr:hypothetical protein [Actinomadura parmotrematis]MBW8484882.1 hypothetical protein [Actinomadura parmotrematis]